MSAIYGNAVGNTAPIKTLKIVDADGNEFVGVVTDSEVLFTATDNDVREGIVYASSEGVSTGTKNIPTYYARCGRKVVLAGKRATLTIPEYNYTNLMIIISDYNTTAEQSIVPTYISVDDGIYAADSNLKLTDVVVNTDDEQIDIGITVDNKSVIRYFVMKEEY